MSERKMIYLCLAHMSENGVEQKYVQEKLTGSEFVLDVMNDLDGNNVSVSVKQSLLCVLVRLIRP